MNKCRITIITAVILVSAVFAVKSFTADESNDLFKANVEALTQNENVQMPCAPAVSVCTFVSEDTQGNKYDTNVPGLKNDPQ